MRRRNIRHVEWRVLPDEDDVDAVKVENGRRFEGDVRALFALQRDDFLRAR